MTRSKILLSSLVLFTFILSVSAMAGQRINPHTNKMGVCVSIEEEDGIPSNRRCKPLKVTNGTLTDNGSYFSLNISPGSGGATSESELESDLVDVTDVYTDNDILKLETHFNANLDFAPVLGADDNYVTDAEKVVIGNTSGTNTGDDPVDYISEVELASLTHLDTQIGTTGTPSAANFLRGDNSWGTPAGSSLWETNGSITSPITLANTLYWDSDTVIGTNTMDNPSSAPDLLVEGNIEVDGNLYIDGDMYIDGTGFTVVIFEESGIPTGLTSTQGGFFVSSADTTPSFVATSGSVSFTLEDGTNRPKGSLSRPLELPTTADTLVPVHTFDVPITFTRLYGITTSGTATITFTDGTNDLDLITATTSGAEDISLTNASFIADETIYMKVTGIISAPEHSLLTGDFTYD